MYQLNEKLVADALRHVADQIEKKQNLKQVIGTITIALQVLHQYDAQLPVEIIASFGSDPDGLVLSDAERSVLLFLSKHSTAKAGRDVDGHAAARLVRRGLVSRSAGIGVRAGRSVWYELTERGEKAVRLIAK